LISVRGKRFFFSSVLLSVLRLEQPLMDTEGKVAEVGDEINLFPVILAEIKNA
jgi:hypothetical protein